MTVGNHFYQFEPQHHSAISPNICWTSGGLFLLFCFLDMLFSLGMLTNNNRSHCKRSCCARFCLAGRLYRCIRCPTAYHVGDFCIAAGSVHLGGYHILCSNHFQPVKSHKHHLRINVSWCFSCSKGGQRPSFVQWNGNFKFKMKNVSAHTSLSML